MPGIDPRWFEPFEPLPDRGAVVVARQRGCQPFFGVVTLVFLACDTACIKVSELMAIGEPPVPIFPEFGDLCVVIA